MPRAVGSVEWAFVVDFYPELVAPLNGCLWLICTLSCGLREMGVRGGRCAQSCGLR